MKRRAPWRTRGGAAAAVILLLVAVAAFGPSLARAQQEEQPQASGQLPRTWHHWKYFRRIRVSEDSQPRLVALLVPVAVYAQAEPGLADLRIIDDRGNEVPFAEITFPGSTRTTYLPRGGIEARSVPGQYTDYILSLGLHPQPCDFLALTGPASNSPAMAQIDVSDDGRDWRPARVRTAIGDWPNPILTFPETSASFLRLRVLHRNGRFMIQTMAAGKQARIPPDRAPVTALLAPEPSTTSRTTLWRIDLHGPAPVDEADFETSQPAFSRLINVFSSTNDQDWMLAGEGVIFRTVRGSTPAERLSVAFLPRRARYWRVELRNENDPPLAAMQLRLSMTPRRIVFREESARSYRLLYGQSEAPAPQYDLAQAVSEETLRAAPLVASVGEEQTNADWVDPRPWSEKHSTVLWVATLLAVLILGLAAVRALRQPE
ncbi:MAG: DUF3999 family protein [Acidobacteriota bacterium]|nr:DUF3999 family protein [Acidobacteriota bacterium]